MKNEKTMKKKTIKFRMNLKLYNDQGKTKNMCIYIQKDRMFGHLKRA